jgi:hypothetical protein
MIKLAVVARNTTFLVIQSDRIVDFHESRAEGPPLPGPLLPPREEREKNIWSSAPRAALAGLACPRLPYFAPPGLGQEGHDE